MTNDIALSAVDAREEGNAAFKAGRLEEALQWYSSAVRQTAGCPVALCNRSLVNIKLGRFQAAVDDAGEAISVLESADGIAENASEHEALTEKAVFRKVTALIELTQVDLAGETIRKHISANGGKSKIMASYLNLLQREEMCVWVAKYWTSLIEDAQSPALLSSRDGKLLKPVPSSSCLAREDLSFFLQSLPRVLLLKLVTSWAKGKPPGRAALAAARSWAYLQAKDVKQAVKDAHYAVAYATGPSTTCCWAGAEMMLALALEEAGDFPNSALAAGKACELDQASKDFKALLYRILNRLTKDQQEIFEKEGVAGLARWLDDEKERKLPEYLRKRPKYYYYYEYMKKRINAVRPALPEPVMDKLLAIDAEELDMVLKYPAAAEGQIEELLGVYEQYGAEYLDGYKPKTLSWEEVKSLEQEAEAAKAEPVGYIERVNPLTLESNSAHDASLLEGVTQTAPADAGDSEDDDDDMDLDALD